MSMNVHVLHLRDDPPSLARERTPELRVDDTIGAEEPWGLNTQRRRILVKRRGCVVHLHGVGEGVTQGSEGVGVK